MTLRQEDRELRRRTYLVPIGELHAWPQRPVRPSAVVIHPDAGTRVELAAELRSRGYDVATCPGPGRACCPAIAGEPQRCPRVAHDLALAVIDERLLATPLPEVYRGWHPGIEIHALAERRPAATAPGRQMYR